MLITIGSPVHCKPVHIKKWIYNVEDHGISLLKTIDLHIALFSVIDNEPENNVEICFPGSFSLRVPNVKKIPYFAFGQQ